MADEEIKNSVEEGLEDLAAVADEAEAAPVDAAEAVAAQVGEAADAVEELAEAALADGQPNEAADVLDERVKAAVRHVAEEADADELVDAVAEQVEEPARKKRERRSKQARAAKAEAVAEAPQPSNTPAKVGGLAGLGVPAWLGISAACLVAGLLLGRFALGGSATGGAAALGGTTVTEEQLDDAYASYTIDGQAHAVSIREVIEQTGTVETALTDDGSYTLPPAEYALTAARTQILKQEVENRGITVADEDVAAYAEKTLGTSDYQAIADTYRMEADAVETLIKEQCQLNVLREEVVGAELPVAPEAPAEPEEGKEEELTKDYADYIIALAGDDWDADKKEWASEDSRFASALEGADFSADGASYTAAQSAYYVAYQVYSEQQAQMSDTWNAFVNELLGKAQIQIGTLLS